MSRESIIKRLTKIETQPEKVRGASPLTHGWQTQRYAKASRTWDKLAEEKRELRQKLYDLCNGDCLSCVDSLTCNHFEQA